MATMDILTRRSSQANANRASMDRVEALVTINLFSELRLLLRIFLYLFMLLSSIFICCPQFSAQTGGMIVPPVADHMVCYLMCIFDTWHLWVDCAEVFHQTLGISKSLA